MSDVWNYNKGKLVKLGRLYVWKVTTRLYKEYNILNFFQITEHFLSIVNTVAAIFHLIYFMSFFNELSIKKIIS